MRSVRICITAFALIALTLNEGCSSSSPAPVPTADGKWTYTTSDGKLKVNFELVKSGSSVTINPVATITVNGTSGTGAAQMSGVNLPDISSITINANDAALTYPHTITFNGSKFNSSTNKIDVTSGSYIIYSPSANTTNFTTVSIVRQ